MGGYFVAQQLHAEARTACGCAAHPVSRRAVLRAGLVLPLLGAAAALTSCASSPRPDVEPETVLPSGNSHPKTHPTSEVAPETLVEKPARAERAAQVAEKYRGATPHAWGTHLPGIVERVSTAPKRLALTFDACGGTHGSLVDEALLTTLQQEQVPATLFLNKRWIDANPQRAQELASNSLFQIENHGSWHKPLSVHGRSAYGVVGTANVDEVVEEIEHNRTFMQEFLGVESNWFRSGTAHYDDIAVRITQELGVSIAGFNVNGDAGATLPAPAVSSNLLGSVPGSIVLLHMNQPSSGTAEGVGMALPQLRAAGYEFVTLGPAVPATL
ncbi:polysaccharide deacetylase family protein [Corynebacterium cystitidis]|uniref:polysaccharide deacetylase family protein n=1 Tax=Corynebacterium cystitidis TaxID=35757 RepID=UPI00211EFF0E|nr:polysaccharide deacetylase family protein [Corynebacterium cystitidis]